VRAHTPAESPTRVNMATAENSSHLRLDSRTRSCHISSASLAEIILGNEKKVVAVQTTHYHHPSFQNLPEDQNITMASFGTDLGPPDDTKYSAKKGLLEVVRSNIAYDIVYDIVYDVMCDIVYEIMLLSRKKNHACGGRGGGVQGRR
jgi:hypothetical protein